LGIAEALIFKPQISIAQWKDENMHDFVSVAIAIPAGLTKKEDTKVRVLDDLSRIRLDARMPQLLSDVKALHSYWSRPGMTPLPAYHPKILAHQDFFASLRSREGDILYSTAVIQLPIQVQKKILAVHRFGTVTGGSIVYIDLEGVNKSEYKDDDGDDFILLDDSPKEKKTKEF
jgi:hypothetical protein